jgi:hypothetical protein
MEQWSDPDPDPGSGIKHPGSATLISTGSLLCEEENSFLLKKFVGAFC